MLHPGAEPRVQRHCRSLRQNVQTRLRSRPSIAGCCYTVLRQVARWFDDYNESHPHSGLGMISPRSSFVLRSISRASGQMGATPVTEHRTLSRIKPVPSEWREKRCHVAASRFSPAAVSGRCPATAPRAVWAKPEMGDGARRGGISCVSASRNLAEARFCFLEQGAPG